MKIVNKNKQSEVNVNDIVKGGIGQYYLVIHNFNRDKFTMVNLSKACLVSGEYDSIDGMLKDYFSEYAVFKENDIELVIK